MHTFWKCIAMFCLEITMHLLTFKVHYVQARFCLVSQPTKTVVENCPGNKEELFAASNRKNCESLAHLQNCSQPDKFRYHCVLSMDKKELLEVCAPVIFSQGYCVGFDSMGSQIQQLFQDPCRLLPQPCSVGGESWNVSEFAGCYALVKREKNKLSTSDDGDQSEIWIPLAITSIICFVGMIAVLIIAVYKWRKGLKNPREQDDAEKVLMEEKDACDLRTQEEHRNMHSQMNTHRKESLPINKEFDEKHFERMKKKYQLNGEIGTKLKEKNINCISVFKQLKDDDFKDMELCRGDFLKCTAAVRDLVEKRKSLPDLTE